MRTKMALLVSLFVFGLLLAGAGMAQAAVSGGACSPSGSSACASDENTQLYCSPTTNLWQFSQYCSTSNRICNMSSGYCKAICGDGICGMYETSADCPTSTDCGPITPQCTGLNLTLNDGKTTYTKGDMVNYTYTCTPGGRAANVTIQIVKPDGTATTYNSATNIDTGTMGFGTDNLAAGSHTLRACFDSNCSSVTASVSFTVAASASACTKLKVGLQDGKTVYTKGDNVSYVFSCETPAEAPAANGIVKLIKPDGTESTLISVSGATALSHSYGFPTTDFAAGTYTLKVCWDNTCPAASTAVASFTVNAPTAATSQCSSGAITSSCYCGGTSSDYLKSTGYCCHSYLSNSLVWTNVPCSQTCQSLGGVCCSGAASDCTGTWSNQWCTDCQGYVCCVGTCKGTIYGPGAPITPTTPTTPPPPTSEQTNCTTGGGKWCLNSDKITGWCSYSSSACPAYDAASCTAQSGEWCTYTSGTGGWCATGGSTCPINDQATCVAKGRSWCLPSGGGTGWCTYSATEKCPAYNATDCAAQNGEWCAATCTGCTGWCSTPPIATSGGTGSYGCPINDKTTCLAKNRNWCLPQSGGTGWCAMINEKCPAYDAASCTAQGSEWCTPQGGGTGWCATGTGGCPIYDKTTCFAKGRKWCTPSYGGTGWCTSTATETCGSGYITESPPATPTPTPTETICPDGTKVPAGTVCPVVTTTCPDGTKVPAGVSCPTTTAEQTRCTTAGGKWCKNSDLVTGWCSYDRIKSCPAYDTTSCTAQGGEWCTSPSSVGGWCATGGSTCPINDKTTCTAKGLEWCASQSTNGYAASGWCDTEKKGCPIADKAACVAKGREWCVPQYSSTGWCSNIGEKCPPAYVPPTEEYTMCPDGTRVHGSCYNTCPDGTQVLHSSPCPEAGTAICAQKGGTWCFDPNNKKGYCSLTGKCFATPTLQPIPTTPMPTEGLSKQAIQKAEWNRDSVIRQLKNLVQNFKKLNDEESLQKITVLMDKAQSAAMDVGVFDYLQAIRDEANTLEEIYAGLKAIGAEQAPEQSERDRQLELRALNQIKKNIRTFEAQLTVIKKRTDALAKKKINIPSELKETLARGVELIKTIKATTNYDEAQDAVFALQDVLQIVNDYLPQLEQLARLPRVFTLINNELKKQDATLKRLRASAKRLKVDIDSLLTEFGDKIAEIRTALTEAKAGNFGDLEPFDYVQTYIVDKLDELADSANTIQAIANLKQTVNTMSAQLTRYETKIKSLERKKKDMAEARAILDEAKAQLKALKTMAAAKLTDDDVFVIKDGLQMLYMAGEQLDRLLQMTRVTTLEKELQRKSTGAESFKSIPLPELEKLSLNATRLATFYKRPASALAGYGTITASFAKQSWRTRFAWDQ